MDETLFAWFHMAAFALALLPALLTNARSGEIGNWDNAIVLMGGVAVVLAGRFVGGQAPPPYLFWGLAFGGLFVLAMMRSVPAGVVKFLAALLPWFDHPGGYFAAITIGFVAIAVAGTLRGGGPFPVVPPLYLAGLGTLAIAAA
jgi:hypothetical protein